MPANRPPPANKRREDLDVRLINVAREILEDEGLEALTLRAAARAAGVSHMAPYRHYQSKDDLLAAVAEEGFEALASAMDDSGGGQDLKRSQGHAYIAFAATNPALYRLMFGTNLPNRARFPGLVAAGEAVFQRCASAVGDMPKDAGDLNAPARAVAYWALLHGLATLAINGLITLPDTNDKDFDRRISALLDAANFSAKSLGR